MPYSVTTKKPRHLDLGKGDLTWVSRRTVATLDEACEGFTLADEAREQFAERGGTVAFHDGTVIEVERQPDDFDVDAYNAAQEQQ